MSVEKAREMAARANWEAKIALFQNGPPWAEKREIMKDEWRGITNAAIDAFLAELGKTHAIVPREATEEMIDTMATYVEADNAVAAVSATKKCYAATLKAAEVRPEAESRSGA